jgi:hypothetical protein
LETTARFYLERMRLQIERAKRSQFPDASDVPAKWLAYVDGRLKSIELRLNRLKDLPSDSRADLHAEELLTNINSCYEALEVLARADTTQVADYVVTPLMRWFKKADPASEYLFTSDTLFEVFPLFEGNLREAEAAHPDHQKAIESLGQMVYGIRMPGGALGAAFHVPLVAHEVGHVLMNNHNEEIEIAILALCKGLSEPDDEIFRNWIVEIIADTICGCVAGPAAFFALHEKLRGNNAPDDNYPHNYVRTASLGAFVHERYASVFSANKLGRTDWKDWKTRSNTDLMAEAALHERYLDLTRRLTGALPKIRKVAAAFAHRHVPDLEYLPTQYAADLKMHLRSFLYAIPPFETDGDLRTRKPTEFASILNVGWFIAAFRLDELKIRAPDGPDRKGKLLVALDQLVMKAIELSELRRQWEGDNERPGAQKTSGPSDGKKSGKTPRRRTAA